ncbi:MAG: hypothetical protein DWQ34_16020 [Planctomycetota bacterium]|nr:MAG: hypothetical protein DWQ29_14465 [Planctomycetota bacterium]REJ91030.1 MAG: hypothetical protein DWQ34_16020 [Planctomycetota bacterium]REK31010.1 MAG: hypothetical protein DWQ41_00875 [Planctomycetota bacterium]REK36873.1 MAG: hypothetical protein DWQ45_09730 [Planctomycetota bacterium]
MSTKRKIEDYDKVLAVEGYSDLLFYAEALEFLEKDEDVYIKDFNGASDLLVKLEVFLDPGLLASKSSIGVILDADTNPHGRIASLTNLMARIAQRQMEHGVWSDGQPKLGFLVVPDSESEGEIETLVWNAWKNDPSNQTSEKCIEDYLACMANAGHQATSPDKGRISTLLAVINDEDPRLGPGARANAFPFDRDEFKPLLAFLDQL